MSEDCAAIQEPTGREYNGSFFGRMDDWASRSAAHIVPMVMDMVQPNSVVDVGCGNGAWLAAFFEHGAADGLGIDGDYVDRDSLKIEADKFLPVDLTRPLSLDRRFDLAVSLEVAEHLPVEAADAFVASLVTLAPVVLFSAAVPGQGGTHHVNEQWPDYWARRFATHNYLVIDAVRPRVWHDEAVAAFYAQNTLIFVNENRLDDYPALRESHHQTQTDRLNIVHPRLFAEKAEQAELIEPLRNQLAHYAANEHLDLSSVLRMIPNLVKRAIRNRFGRR